MAGSVIMGWLGRGSDLGCRGDELASAGELLGASGAAIGEQTVVSDAMKALRQDVHEEAANELAGLQGHGLVSLGALDAVIFEGRSS